MNKIEFLRRLDRELEVLDKEERKELLAFYEERFYSGTIYEHKTEAEVIAELESPETIARNILEEYGVSPKFVKTKEERYSNVETGKVVGLAIFDLLVVSWVIPTLYSVVVALFGSLFSYIGVIGLLIGDRTEENVMLFAFLTSVYVLIFFFAVLILELSISITKKIIVYHLNVFKIKNREKIAKNFHKISIDEWFKKHKLASLIRSLAFIAAIFTIVYSGFYLFTGDNNIIDTYSNQPQETDLYEEVLTQDILDGDRWTISTNFDSMDIVVIPVLGDKLMVTHEYQDLNDFMIDIDVDANTITISNDDPQVINWFSFDNFFTLFGENDSVTIEIPVGLLLGDIDLKTLNGEVKMMDINSGKIEIIGMNGSISLSGLTVSGDVSIETTNGEIYLKDIAGKHDLDASSTNGSMIINNVEFLHYTLSTTNGYFNLDNLNVNDQDGLSLVANTTNGRINLDEVYVKSVNLDTTNGNISFYNDDESFDVTSFKRDTTNGEISTNIR
ncbi:MAG: DUF1700 domain-containing protein [Bacilli bacterium]|nr:DUF1700 domain-containing protein [Bacilli bacterium]